MHCILADRCIYDLITNVLVQPKDMGLPTTAYYAKDEVREVSQVLISCSRTRMTSYSGRVLRQCCTEGRGLPCAAHKEDWQTTELLLADEHFCSGAECWAEHARHASCPHDSLQSKLQFCSLQLCNLPAS